jgi:Arc/MetJ-type ribon-helix-helix transcriptional regulator
MTSVITVRLSEKEKRELRRQGNISEVVREAVRNYLKDRRSREIISRLMEIQSKRTTRTSLSDDLKLIRVDRER